MYSYSVVSLYIDTALYVFSYSFMYSYSVVSLYIDTALYVFSYIFMYSYSFISLPKSESLRKFPLSLNRHYTVNTYGRLEV